jgi:hypothetical protein
VTTGDYEAVPAALVGGAYPRTRLAIHARHYETSLSNALCQKFPAVGWLLGPGLLTDAARAYVRAHPPRTPCIAEYGNDFPGFIAEYRHAAAYPYLRSFAELERAIANVSIAIALPPLEWAEVARMGADRLLELRLTLQPGLHYLHLPWDVDRLMRSYLENLEPDTFTLTQSEAFVEVRGARGALWITPLERAAFTFRSELESGQSIAIAAEHAIDHDPQFDAGAALMELTQWGLAVSLATKERTP